MAWKTSFERLASGDWIDIRLKTSSTNWNDHWNNHVRFVMVMEPYMTFSHAVKHRDIGLLRHAIREVCIILQVPSASKPKYARVILRQLHIFDTNASSPQLQEAYLANSLVNPRGLPHPFYEIDLLLQHQNGKFMRFRTDRRSSLQETDQMFRQHALSVDALRKVRLGMNKVIVGRDLTGKYISQTS